MIHMSFAIAKRAARRRRLRPMSVIPIPPEKRQLYELLMARQKTLERYILGCVRPKFKDDVLGWLREYTALHIWLYHDGLAIAGKLRGIKVVKEKTDDG